TKDNDWRKLSVIGNLTNNGVITENNYSTFDIEITGNIINNGIWEYCWAIMNGKVDQTINNTNSFTGNVRLTANVSSSSTYQWYKNATAISGATSDMYEILTFQEENNGLYYCQTDAGNSRTITIVRNSPYGEEILTENFDGTQFPPNGWTQSTLNSSKTWMQGNSISHLFGEIDATNVYSAICPWVAQPQNEWLKTPIVSFPNDAISLEFYAGFSTAYLLNATMKLNLSTDGGSNWTKIWEANNDGNDWQWRKVTLDLSSYTNNSNVMLAWQYVGNDGDLMGIDNVKLMHGTVDVKDNSAEIPTEYVLTQNYPNPFNPTTKISYSIPSNSNVTIKIFDALGRIVATLVNEEKTAGKYTVEFNGSNLSSGVYFYRLKAENFVDTKKLMLLK
ncbi:MAG: choice-of-anchor J domain-containing protein, partial [Ignavibacteriaceae bacterium]